MAQPTYPVTRLLPLGQNRAADADLAYRLRQVAVSPKQSSSSKKTSLI